MISKEQQHQFAQYLIEYSDAERKTEVYRQSLWECLGENKDTIQVIFRMIIKFAPQPDQTEIITPEQLKLFLTKMTIKFFPPDLHNFMISHSESRQPNWSFMDFLTILIPKRYYFTELLTTLNKRFKKDNLYFIQQNQQKNITTNINNVINNVSWGTSSVKLKLSKKYQGQDVELKNINNNYPTYWGASKIIEQELFNRKKQSTLVNIISTEEGFNCKLLFSVIDLDSRGLNRGYISTHEFRQFSQKTNHQLTKHQAENIFFRLKRTQSEAVTFLDFKTSFFENYYTGGYENNYQYNFCLPDNKAFTEMKDRLFNPVADKKHSETPQINRTRNSSFYIPRTDTFEYMTQPNTHSKSFRNQSIDSQVNQPNCDDSRYNTQNNGGVSKKGWLLEHKINFQKKSIYTERTEQGRYKQGTIVRELRRNDGKTGAMKLIKELFIVMAEGERHLKKQKEIIGIETTGDLQKYSDFCFGSLEKTTSAIFQKMCTNELKMSVADKGCINIFSRVDPNSQQTMERASFCNFLLEGVEEAYRPAIPTKDLNSKTDTDQLEDDKEKIVQKRRVSVIVDENGNSRVVHYEEPDIESNLRSVFATIVTLETKLQELIEQYAIKTEKQYDYAFEKLDGNKKGVITKTDIYRFMSSPVNKFGYVKAKSIINRFTRYRQDYVDFDTFVTELTPRFGIGASKDGKKGFGGTAGCNGGMLKEIKKNLSCY